MDGNNCHPSTVRVKTQSLRLSALCRDYRYVRLVFTGLLECHCAIDQCIKSMVSAHSDVFAGIVYSASLTHQDVACFRSLSAKQFNAQAFAFRFTAVLGTTDTFFVSHNLNVLSDFVNLNFSKILTVTVLLRHTFTADLVENDNLVSFAMLHNGSLDSSTGHIR